MLNTLNDPLYIIGDVHGCFNTLLALVDSLPKNDKATLIFVGDVVDRGAHSAHIIDWIINNGHTCLKGNHESVMLEALAYPENASLTDLWKRNGGTETLNSYNEFDPGTLSKHLVWMKELPNYLELDIEDENGKQLFVTHAFGLPYWQERDIQKNNVRFRVNRFDKYKETYFDYPVFNVFGHSVQDDALITHNFAAIDTGCVFGGSLCALEWPSKRVFLQGNIERE